MNRHLSTDGPGEHSPAFGAGELALCNPFEPVPLRPRLGVAGGGRVSQRLRRSHVLAAIRKLVTEVGCENVTVRGIADASGYAVQTVYNLVGPRDQAISDAISEYSIFVGRTAAPQDEDPCTIPAIVDRWLQAIDMTPEFVRQSNLVFFTGSRRIYYRFRERQVSGLYNLLRRQKARGIIRDDVDVRMLSERLGLFSSAMCIEWSDRPFPLEALHDKLCSGITDMLTESLTPAHRERVTDRMALARDGRLAWRPRTGGAA